MKQQFTYNDIERFFEQFKLLPEIIELDKVHQIINNPQAMATPKGKHFFKPLKITIMTTTFVTGVALLMMWLAPEKTENKPQPTKNTVIEITQTESENKPTTKLNSSGTSVIKQQFTQSSNSKDNQQPLSALIKNENSKENQQQNKQENESFVSNWSKDTVLDKQNLFVKLSVKEQEKIGMFYRVDSTKIPQMEVFAKLYKGGIHISLGPNHKGGSFSMIGYKKDHKYIRAFNAKYTSNIDCNDERWNSPFYNVIDTLVPVIVDKKIYWNIPNKAFFDSLPDRYKHLENIYKNLTYLKKQNPENQFTNYWNKNMLLGDIKFLELSRSELENIGVCFWEDSVYSGYKVVDAYSNKQYYSYKAKKYKSNSYSTTSRDTIAPSTLPLIKTDEKGLNQRYFLSRNKNNNFNPDLLIAIKIPINEYLKRDENFDIYWYNPNDSFINLLPERIRTQLKSEKENIINAPVIQTKSSENTCTYFEVCKSTLQLEGLKIFPNPAKGRATLQFTSKDDLVGDISIRNMAGVEIAKLNAKTNMKAGFNSLEIDISGFPSGIYIVSVNTDKGFRTQRIIISK